jgi:hypothetical protein
MALGAPDGLAQVQITHFPATSTPEPEPPDVGHRLVPDDCDAGLIDTQILAFAAKIDSVRGPAAMVSCQIVITRDEPGGCAHVLCLPRTDEIADALDTALSCLSSPM